MTGSPGQIQISTLDVEDFLSKFILAHSCTFELTISLSELI